MTSKAEYLKKYYGGGEMKKKKKKVTKQTTNKSTVIILDDNPDWRNSGQSNDEDDSDTPIIVEYRDEQKEMEMKARWRPLVKQEVKQEVKEESQSSPSHDYVPTIQDGRSRNQRHDSPEGQEVTSHRSRGDNTAGGRHDSDASPPRRQGRHDSDTSPPRRQGRHDSDTSPPRRQGRHDSDASPPRRQGRHDSDASPPRKQGRHDSDASPPRRQGRHDSDASPPRRQGRHDSDASPPRRQGRHDSDPSSPRRRAARNTNHSDSDASPPRRRPQQKQQSNDGTNSRSRQERSERKLQSRETGATMDSRSNEGTSDQLARKRPDSNKMKMASGGRAGLQSGKDVKVQKQQLKDIDDSITGKGAETVYRRDGKKIDPKLEKLKKKEEEKKKAEQDEQFYEWGRGVAQTRMAHEKVTDDLHEMSKPLARYKDDEDLENMLKAREREDDPMLQYIKSKKAKKNVTIDSHGRKRPKKERPTYKGSFPPNRFSIRPGYRWDGIDRSNGFEQSWFAREANKVAIAEVAYKWSVEDM